MCQQKTAKKIYYHKIELLILCVIGHTVSSPELHNILLFVQIAFKETANQYKLFAGF